MKFQSKVTANWDRMERVEGRVIDRGESTIEDRVRPFILVTTEQGPVQVFQSAGLDDTFAQVELGDRISIEHLGTVQTSKGRTFRQFRTQVWIDPDDAPLPKGVASAVATRGGRKPR